MSENEAVMRWDPYSLTRDADFDAFWSAHLGKRERRVLLVLGRGFDIRALETARRLKGVGANVSVWLLAFDNGLGDSPSRTALTAANYKGLEDLYGAAAITDVDIAIGGPSGEIATSRNTKIAIEAAGDFTQFEDIVVDISAMPRMVAMTTIAVLLARLDGIAGTNGGKSVNLHVTTAESVSADLGGSRGTLQDRVTQVVGFSGELTSQTKENWPRVWFPIMGEGQQARLDLIRDLVDPDEICPVVPFPSSEPRRGDEIIDEHRGTLFDEFQIEPKNILLACEYNPFEAYKQIFVAMDRYRRALSELGGRKAFVSPLSSKLLSVAVLLACYDHRFGEIAGQRLDVGIPYVETAVYGDPAQGQEAAFELYSMWICGEWEEA